MHAVVVRVTVNNLEGAEQTLQTEVVPRTSSAPGFQAGYWTRDGNSGLSMAIFDTEENARAVAERIPGTVPEDVTLEGVEVREVVASA
jgi:hypothetical protein